MAFGVTQRRAVALPEESTGFVGRSTELAHVGDLLARTRLVTVTGVGGVGKTRLALRAATMAERHFADGARLVELSTVRDPELLPYAIATCFGLPEQDARPQLDALLGYLRTRKLLLILDTCEHLIDACAMLVEAVLRDAPGVTMLVTSRQPLDVPGENVCPLAPLSGDAVELFVQRAAATVPGFQLTDANRADVLRLCQRLDGIPLAIELAAVRLRALSLAELANRLETRFPLLTGARRGTTDRHKTLRDAIGWSYDLCSPVERELWARLSVFAGPFSLSAAAEVCASGELTTDEVVETVIRLVDKSVLQRESEPDTSYRMLDTIREFGLERLSASGHEGAVRDRHAARYLAMATRFDASPLRGQLSSFQALNAEHTDVQAALRHAFSAPASVRPGGAAVGVEDDGAAEMATSLLWYWQISGLLREGRSWLTKAVERLADPSPRRAAALLCRGYLAAYQGETAAGLADTKAGLGMLAGLGATRPGDEQELLRLRARGLVFHCRALTSAGRLDEAAEAGEAAARLLDALVSTGPASTGPASAADEGIRVILVTHLAYLDLLTGNLDECLARCALGLRLAGPDRGERWASSYLHGLTGLALYLRGEHDRGNVAVRAGLAMKRELGDTVGIAYGLGVLAMVAAGQGRPQRAALAIGAADPLWAWLGSVFSGTPTMRTLLDDAVHTARQALGEESFGRLRRDGALASLSAVLAMAIDDADALAQPAATPAAPPNPVPTRPPNPLPTRPPNPVLTSREREIAALVANGLSNRQVAELLVISKRTVDAHIEHIFSKLDMSSRLQLAAWLREHE